MAVQTFKIALAGNPNVGKSTIFNALTGSRQHVGNWPGKTVEKKEGRLHVEGQDVIVVDLPGTYSLTILNTENGCSQTASITVDQDITPPAVQAATPEVVTCDVPTVVIDASSSSSVRAAGSAASAARIETSQVLATVAG